MTQDPRRDFSIPIPIEVKRSDGTRETEYAVNLSPRGLCLQLKRPIAVGEQVELRFALPPSGPSILAMGKVVWAEHEGKLDGARRFWETGVHLADLPESAREALARYANQPIDRRR